MGRMFFHANLFTGDLSKWDVSSVKNMFEMFWFASSFNGDVSKWDVSRVVKMSKMFWQASLFNADLSTWDVSSVKDMTSMFQRATSFSGDLSKWDVSSVTGMSGMFRWATSFNGDVSKWDVSSVADMDYMFQHARSFKQKLCGAAWVNSKVSKLGIFEGSPGSISITVCTTAPAFSPHSNVELKSAVTACVDKKVSPPSISEQKKTSGSRSAGVVFDLDGVIYHRSSSRVVATPGYSLRICMSEQIGLV